MSALTTVQTLLQDYILNGRDRISPLVSHSAGASVERRLAIYRSGYRQRLIEALSTDFETLAAVLGPDRFRDMCEAYVEATPSSFRNVRWYGGHLSQFLASSEPWCRRIELAEIARFEWSLTLAFDAEDRAVLRFDDLAQLSPEAWADLQLVFHPSLQCLTLHTNAPALRLALQGDAQRPEVRREDEAVHWAVWRKAGDPHFRSLPSYERWCVDAVLQGRTFSDLCEGIVEFSSADQAPALAAGLLRAWLEDEWVAGFTCGNAD